MHDPSSRLASLRDDLARRIAALVGEIEALKEERGDVHPARARLAAHHAKKRLDRREQDAAA